MPHSDIHKKKLKKNLTVAGMILLWCALIWMVTMIRIANAAEPSFPPRFVGKNYSGIGIARAPADARGPFYKSRAEHANNAAATTDQWATAYQESLNLRHAAAETRADQRIAQRNRQTATDDDWNNVWHRDSIRRRQQDGQVEAARAAHKDKIAAQPQIWWDGWHVRQAGRDD